MERFRVRIGNIDGFLARSVMAGDQGQLINRGFVTADDPRFYMWVNELEGILLGPAGLSGDRVNVFLAIIHPAEGVAEIYLNYYPVLTGRAVGDIKAGDLLTVGSIRDISHYEVPGAEVRAGDKAVCVIKSGWRFGLLFDFTGEIESADDLWRSLGSLSNLLHLRRDIEELRIAAALASRPYLVTEGKTDQIHMEAARKVLKPALDLGYFSPSDDMRGESRLFQICEAMSRGGGLNRNKVIAIFDSDVEKTVRKLRELSGPGARFQDWGNSVFSLILPPPSHRPAAAELCIEDLYLDADLMKADSNGRRLHFEDEIERQPSIDGSGFWWIRRGSSGPIPEIRKHAKGRVERIVDEDGSQVAISKARFAQLVSDGEGAFVDVDFSGFHPLFDIIEEIIDLPPLRG